MKKCVLLNSPERGTGRSGFTLVELVTVTGLIVLMCSLLLPAVQRAREAARQNLCQNNLMQIGLALNHYMMTHGVLPPGSQNATGPIKSVANGGYHMGWLTQILPFIEQQNAYDRLDFTKPIDDRANDSVSAHVFPILKCPSGISGGTSYRGVHHDFEAPINVNQNGVLFLNSSIDQDQITDGCSHTAYVMETTGNWSGLLSWASGTRASLCNAVIRKSLTKSGSTDSTNRDSDVRYELHAGTDNPGTSRSTDINALKEELSSIEVSDELVGGPSSAHAGLFNVVMGDGAVRSASKSIDARVLRNMAHRSDGELPTE